MRVQKGSLACLLVLSCIVLVAALTGRVNACEQCEPSPPILAAQADDGAGAADDGFNPGIILLIVVVASVIVATVMVLRQSKPGLPEGYDDAPEDGTSGDRDTSSS